MSITPAIHQSNTAWADAPERFPLFTIVDPDGVATEYTMPRAKHPGIVLEYLRQSRRHGEEIAASWLLEQVAGDAGYTALVGEPDLTFETVNKIAKAALQVLTGRAPAVTPPPAPEAAQPEPTEGGAPFG